MLTITEEQVKSLIEPEQAVDAIEAAFRYKYGASAQLPLRTVATVDSDNIFLIMPCFDSSMSSLGIKLVTVVARPKEGDERVQASYVLLDPQTGKIRAIIASNYLTDFRTAATSLVATKFLARPDSKVLGIIGTGRQARAHAHLFQRIWHFNLVLVCGSTPAKGQEFADRLRHDLNLVTEVVDSNTCAANADIVCTCTSSTTPLFDGDLLSQGAHVNLIGAFRPDAREVDEKCIRRAKVVVETYEGVLAEAGDLLIPMRQGLIGRKHIQADLHELVAGKKRVRSSPKDITAFKSVGYALEDLVVASIVYGAASQGNDRSL